MTKSLSELKPYKSLLLGRVRDEVAVGSVLGTVLADLGQLLGLAADGPRQLVSRRKPTKSGDLLVGFLHYTDERTPTWTTSTNFKDNINQLIVACRLKKLVAIYVSDARLRPLITKQFSREGERGLGALERIEPGIINAAFVRGAARTLWLSGTHRRTSVKADNKILSGIDLQDALDPLDDQTYYFTPARCASEIKKESVTVGSSPRGSRIWVGISNNWTEFRDSVTKLLDHIDSIKRAENAPLPIVAISSIKTAAVRDAFDVAVMPPEILADDPTMDEEEREEMEKWSYESDFTILKTVGPNLDTQVTLNGNPVGTVKFTIDLTDPQRVSWELEGEPVSPLLKTQHQKALSVCRRRDWVKFWYESGHTVAGGAAYEIRHRDIPFGNFQWIDFSHYDVTAEKPSPLNKNTIGTQGSLFCWVKNVWPIRGLGAVSGGWLASDDGSMEIADFIHIDDSSDPPRLSLIHAKGAGSSDANRGLSVSNYEVVTSQAIKNLRSLDRELLAGGLHGGLGKKISSLVWYKRKPSTRKYMIAALKNIGANYERQVVTLQPHVTKARWDSSRANPKSADAARLRQLDTLLVARRHHVILSVRGWS